MGRTGKKNPRMGVDFIKWADEDSVVKIISNVYAFAKKYIDPTAPGGKEHIGYMVDRTGPEEFIKFILQDVHPCRRRRKSIVLSTGPVFATSA